AVKGLEESFLVEAGLGLDQDVIEPLQQLIVAGGKGIMDRLLDRVVGIAGPAVDVGYAMAGGAGDAGLGRGMVDVVIAGIVEGAAEKGDWIVAAGAPARGADAGFLPCLAHAEQ